MSCTEVSRPPAISACSCATVNSLYVVGAAVAQLPLNVVVRATTTDGTSRMIARIASTFLRMSLLLLAIRARCASTWCGPQQTKQAGSRSRKRTADALRGAACSLLRAGTNGDHRPAVALCPEQEVHALVGLSRL